MAEPKNAESRGKGPAKPQGQILPGSFPMLPIPVVARLMAGDIRRYAEELLALASRLEAKDPRDTIEVVWPPPMVLRCNGGGD